MSDEDQDQKGYVSVKQAHNVRRREAYAELVAVRPPKLHCPDKSHLHEVAADIVGRNNPVDYFEFGVSFGQATRNFARAFKHPEARLVGFDSFQGLPEDWYKLKRGQFSRQGEAPNITDPRVSFVTGYFQNTVFDYFSKWRPRPGANVLVNYDADIYGSTVHVLAMMWPYVPEYYFLMDEFWHDDLVALHDFTKAFPVEVTWHAAVMHNERPAKILGHMRRVVFKPKDEPAATAT